MVPATRAVSSSNTATSLSRSPRRERSFTFALPMMAMRSSTIMSLECTYTCSVARRPPTLWSPHTVLSAHPRPLDPPRGVPAEPVVPERPERLPLPPPLSLLPPPNSDHLRGAPAADAPRPTARPPTVCALWPRFGVRRCACPRPPSLASSVLDAECSEADEASRLRRSEPEPPAAAAASSSAVAAAVAAMELAPPPPRLPRPLGWDASSAGADATEARSRAPTEAYGGGWPVAASGGGGAPAPLTDVAAA
mmetsp:Transcript_29098/g.94898  ORF Transcript_29098/g.94898 Transcript_29098/m.94898 type:complete len:251 (+) Transcript_29098:597-1349(+)